MLGQAAIISSTDTASPRSPSPDFSSMTLEELDRLEQVLKKQVEIEAEQKQNLAGLRRTMLHLQQTMKTDQSRKRTASSSPINASPVHQTSMILSSSDIVQCYICFSMIEIKPFGSSSPITILCCDCHQPVCRRCGNYTSPEFHRISDGNHLENQSHASKWRCRMCIVRREVVRKSGSWNMNEDDTPAHSPVRLLQKLAAYRASRLLSALESSPQVEEKPSIFTESANFIARLWRPTPQSPKVSKKLIQVHASRSNSFDNIPESYPTQTESSSVLSSPSITHHVPSTTCEIPYKAISHTDTSQSSSVSASLVNSSLIPSKNRTSSTYTDPSFEETTSETPYDSGSAFLSQNLDTDMDDSNPAIAEEQDKQRKDLPQRMTYDERQRRLSLTSDTLHSSILRQSFLLRKNNESNRSDSQYSPETSIDLSTAMGHYSKSSDLRIDSSLFDSPMTSIDIGDHEDTLNRRVSRSGVRNSQSWVKKRALMQRGGEWKTTLDRENVATCKDPVIEFRSLNNTTSLPTAVKDRNEYERSSSTETTVSMSPKSDSSQSNTIRRKRSSRQLPPIPAEPMSPTDIATTCSSHSENIVTDSSTERLRSPLRENSLSARSNRSKSIDSESATKSRSGHTKLLQTHQTMNAKSIDVSNLARRKSFLTVTDPLIPQRSLDYPYIVRKAQDLSDIVRRRMLYSKISKQQQGESCSISMEREHVPKVPRKIIIRQDNSIEIALSKPPKLRRQTLSEDYYHACNPDADYGHAPGSNGSSTLGLPLSTSVAGSINNDRRKTIETCENIYLHAEESSKLRARTPPANPHRILLHRDKGDTSIRTNGLGMRIIGGQECEDGSLGCFVTSVTSGGPAEIQGNIEVGDQILEFNGNSLIDSTYEEVRMLQDQCGDIVQLVVQHNNIRLQINGGQTLSSIEVSRHFETIPRLSSSLTRKRRNLPPLPPSLSSTFAKQPKCQLYQTVETLEVPNVKELKPILINRGRLLAQLWHDIDEMQLALTVIQAANLPLRSNGDQPYAYLAGKMIFEDRGFDMFETKVIHSSNPMFNETFVFHDVDAIETLRLEIIVWDKRQTHQLYRGMDDSDEFIGTVQVPLIEANLDDEPRWYELRDRQARKSSTTNVTFQSSSNERGGSFRNSQQPPAIVVGCREENKTVSTDATTNVNIRSNLKKFQRGTSIPTQVRKHSMIHIQTAPLTRKNLHRASIADPSGILVKRTSVPTTDSKIDEIDDSNDEQQSGQNRRQSVIVTQSAKLSRRISQGLLKLFDMNHRRFSETPSKSPKAATKRKFSTQGPLLTDSEDDGDMPIGITIDGSPRLSIVSTTNPDDLQSNHMHSIPLHQMPIGQLMLPYISSSRHSSISGSRKSSAASYCDSDDDIDRYFTFAEQLEANTNEDDQQHGNVQTHTVGPGQVAPRNYENMINDCIHMGEIQLGLIVTKGLLEIDVICCKALQKILDDNNSGQAADEIPPDTYVKTYLRTGTRRVQKRKTKTVKATFNPEYHSKLKYNACNVMGRRLQVTVWQRAKKFEKNQCIGEAFIQLDSLTLTQLTIAWYKLFREKLVESEFYDSS